MELLQRKLKSESTKIPNVLMRLGLPILLLIGLTPKLPWQMSWQKPALAVTCQPLGVVKGEGNQVQKTVTLPSVPIGIGRLFNNNWNTDFSVPSNASYATYVATLIPEDDGTYSIRMNLKYSDGTHDKVYDNKPKLAANQPLKMSGSPRLNEQPYQINIFVGDPDSVGKSYKISVSGCR
jgi:hypothetical protein